MSQMPSAQNTVNATQNTRKNRKYGADAYNKSIGEEIEKKTAITVDERKNEHIEVIAEDTIQKIIQKNKMSHIKSGEGKTLSTADQQFDQQEETGYSKLFDLYNRGIESAKEEFGNVQSFIEHVASLGSEISGNEWPDTWLNFEKIMN
jgi:3D (Asp-Asp-Asp) domain-containing protein